MNILRTLTLAAFATMALAAPTLAQDAMAADPMATDAMATDAMATDAMATDAMAPMSDADFELCSQQAGAITFPNVMAAAVAACNGLHQGADAMAPAETMTPAQ